MSGSRARQAALNNASWCDAVCNAHARPGCFDAGVGFDRSGPLRIWVRD
jgi:hypothetical protein